MPRKRKLMGISIIMFCGVNDEEKYTCCLWLKRSDMICTSADGYKP